MTRKRFKKLMMSMGCSRNLAETYARVVVGRARCRETAHRLALYGFDFCALATEALDYAYRVLSKVCGAVCAGLSAFAQAVHEAMEGDNADNHG